MLREARNMVGALKHSLEHPINFQQLKASELANFTNAVLSVEQVRLAFRMRERGMLREPLGEEQKFDLLAQVRELMSNDNFKKFAAVLPYRAGTGPRSQDAFEKSLPKSASVLRVTELLIDRLEALAGFARGETIQRDVQELKRMVPEQKAAPAQFEIRNGRIALMHSESKPDDEDKQNVAVAKEELERNGENILNELERSNCDRRLIETVRHLQDQLIRGQNIVAVGLTNLTCGAMCTAFQHELPDAVGAMLTAHNRGIDLYVGQFPEWRRFIDNAAEVQLTHEDIEALHNSAEMIAAKLERQPELAEPEVPATVKRLNELLKYPAKSGRRAVFAVLRTLENLIGKAIFHGADLLAKSIEKTKEQVSAVVGKTAAIILLGIALESAITISPIAGKITEANWLQGAIQLVQKSIQRIGQ